MSDSSNKDNWYEESMEPIDFEKKIIRVGEDWNVAKRCLEALKNGEDNSKLLYKYQAINEYSLDALKNNYLYFSKFPQLNDPFDPLITLLAKKQDRLKYDTELASLFREHAKILCLTEVAFHVILWSNYADNWKGMQIEYATLNHPGMFQPMKYMNEFHKEHPIEDFLMIKGIQWSYEKEWRAIKYSEGQSYYDFSYPIRVTLGPRTGHERMLKVRESLPSTVEKFEVIYPTLENGRIQLAVYDIDYFLEVHGRLLTIDEMYWK